MTRVHREIAESLELLSLVMVTAARPTALLLSCIALYLLPFAAVGLAALVFQVGKVVLIGDSTRMPSWQDCEEIGGILGGFLYPIFIMLPLRRVNPRAFRWWAAIGLVLAAGFAWPSWALCRQVTGDLLLQDRPFAHVLALTILVPMYLYVPALYVLRRLEAGAESAEPCAGAKGDGR